MSAAYFYKRFEVYIMDFYKLADERYSCRKFSDREVEREKLEKIMDVAVMAPSAVNYQPIKVWLMESESAREILQKVTPYRFVHKVKHVFVIGGRKNSSWTRESDNKNFADVDAAIAATHMLLEIHDLGLRSTWVGDIDIKLLKELCPQMADYEIVAMLPVGYASDEPKSGPCKLHFTRKSREEIVEVL